MNKQQVKQLAVQNGLDVIEDTMQANESGLDFQVFHAEDQSGEKWILRIPRRSVSMAKAGQEKAVLDAVNRYTLIEAPHWKVFTDELVAYKQLKGVPAGTIDPAIQNYVWEFDIENSPDAYHTSLGRLLADLHRMPAVHVKDAGIVMHDHIEARQSMAARMEKVKQTFGVSRKLWERWQAWIANDVLWPDHTGLTHGDVHPGHILINPQAEAAGLIDWTEAAVTDVSRDFAAHYLIFGEAGLNKVIDAYEKAGGLTWPGMKEHITELRAAEAVIVAEFAWSSGLKEMEDMARQMLGVADPQ